MWRRGLVALAAVAALGACQFPDVTPGVGPADPFKSGIHRAINDARAARGLAALEYSPKLDNLAGTWSWNMAQTQSLSHQDLGSVLAEPEYQAFSELGETVLVSSAAMEPHRVVAAWIRSRSHEAQLLDNRHGVVGIGSFVDDGGTLWVTAVYGSLR